MEKIDLTPIFYSNYNAGIDYYSLDELAFLFDNRCLNYKKEPVGSLKEFYDFIDKINNREIKVFDIEGGGNRHLALKLIGLKYYEKTSKTALVENWFHGYRPDLLFKNRAGCVIIVECGDTSPVKIMEYFDRPEVEKVIIISYPEEGEDFIYQHIFSKNKALDEYLRIKKEINLKKIKRIINKR